MRAMREIRAAQAVRTLFAGVCMPALVFVLAFAGVRTVYGQAMSSSNYKIQSDTVNFAGARSGSGSYSLEDTVGEIATGVSSSTNYTMNAGYQQMQEVYLAITSAANVTMSPSIGGLTGGTSNGSTSFTVTTDDPAGYTASITASTSPALRSATDTFADYVPGGANPDFVFANAATASSFAFTVEGTDIHSRFMDNGSSCGTGSGNTADACWDGLTTAPKSILSRAGATQPNGTATTLKFRAESGSGHIQTNGVYTATTTITVVPL